jgi:hypothetical protein
MTAEYSSQHFVGVKVDFDASPALVAQLQRAQTVVNLPGLPLTLLWRGVPAESQGEKSSFREAADEALGRYG